MLKKEDGLCYIKIVIKKSRHRGREIWFLSYIGKKKEKEKRTFKENKFLKNTVCRIMKSFFNNSIVKLTPQSRMGSSSVLDNSYFLILTRALYPFTGTNLFKFHNNLK